MATKKSKLTRQQLLDNMKKESKSATRKAKAADAPKTAPKPSPKKMSAPKTTKTPKKPSMAQELYRKLSTPQAAPQVADQRGPAPKQLTDRRAPAAKQLTGPQEPLRLTDQSLRADPAARPEAPRPRMSVGGGLAGLLGIGSVFAAMREADPESFDNTIRDFISPSATIDKIKDLGSSMMGRTEELSAARKVRAENSAGNQRARMIRETASSTPQDGDLSEDFLNRMPDLATPSIADERAKLDKAAPTSARAIRKTAVRETGGPLTDEEIFAWNRENNKNYRD
jgi:hypothetical protein